MSLWIHSPHLFQRKQVELSLHGFCQNAKTTKTSHEVLVGSFKNPIKNPSSKNQKFAISCPLFCLNYELPGIEPASMENFQLPWLISQTLRWKKPISICIWNHYVLQNGELSLPNRQIPKTQSVDLFCSSILMFTSVQSLVISSQRSTKSDVLKLGPVSAHCA